MSLKTTCIALASSLAVAFPVAAQDVSGTMTGTLGLEDAIWYLRPADGGDASGWTWDGDEAVVRLVGHVRRGNSDASGGALTIAFRTEGNPTELDVSEFTISMEPREQDGPGPAFSAGGANADLDVETLVVSGTDMVVAGSFSGRLIRGGADELVLHEDVPSVTVDGNFQATIPQMSE